MTMEGACSSKTTQKTGADRESRRSTNSASPTHMRQRSNNEQSGNLGLTGSVFNFMIHARTSQSTVVVRRHTKNRSWQ